MPAHPPRPRDLAETLVLACNAASFGARRPMMPQEPPRLAPPPPKPHAPPLTYAYALRELLRATTCRDEGAALPPCEFPDKAHGPGVDGSAITKVRQRPPALAGRAAN